MPAGRKPTFARAHPGPRRSFVPYALPSSPGRDGAPAAQAAGGASGPKPRPRPGVTTLAVGEESGAPPRPRPDVTTLAIGEEGAGPR